MADEIAESKPFGRYAGKSKRDFYEAIATALMTERASFDSHWRELADYFFPRRARFTVSDRNKGDKRNQNIIDSTGRLAARTLSSGLHAGLTSPARPWMKLTTPDPKLAEFGQVKEWLHTVTERMLTVFLQSNLYNALPTVYGDLGVFGTGATSVLEDGPDLFRCYTYPIGSYALGVDSRGLVTTFVRRYQLTVRALIEEFALQENGDVDWSRVSSTARGLYDRGLTEAPVDVTWIVHPNPEHDRRQYLSKYKRWASCHFETGDTGGIFLREKGYDTFPVLCPRWAITGEDAYGTESPGMDALGDNKQLQLMHREKAKAIQKMVNPPVQGPSSLRNQKTSLISGEITYVDVRDANAGLRSIHDVTLKIGELSTDIGMVQYRIQRAFYEDLFLMLAQSDPMRGTQPITAEEVRERHEEKLLALGPVLERTNDELLDPLVDRVFNMMQRAGLIPEPPEELDGVDLKVEYISVMAQAQKLVGVVALDRFVQSVAPIVQFFPDVRHKVDPMVLVDEYGAALGVNPKLIRSTEDAQRDADAERKMAAGQAASEQAKNYGAAARDAAAAPMDGDTALTRIAPALAGAA